MRNTKIITINRHDVCNDVISMQWCDIDDNNNDDNNDNDNDNDNNEKSLKFQSVRIIEK